MNAIVFAAGIGKRMGSLTKDTPKCLLPVGGGTMLSRWFDTLLALGVDHIYFNTHHLAEKVRFYVAQRYPEEVIDGRIVEWHEPTLLGSAATVRAHKRMLPGTTVLIYADVWTDLDLAPMIAYHVMSGDCLTLGAFETDEPERCGIIEIEADRVVSFTEKPKRPKGRIAWSGIAVVPDRLFGWHWKNKDIASDLIPYLIARDCVTIGAYPITDPVIDIGTKEGYKHAQEAANESIR